MAALSAFHSLFLCSKGDLYSVGHGAGGRLGHGQENTVVQPQKVKLTLRQTDEKIISVSASKNHSLLLSNQDRIYACGTNEFGQLGRKGNDSCLSFFCIAWPAFQDQKLTRVIALDNHSVVYGGQSVFAWGHNIGQLGLKSTVEFIKNPQVVLSGQPIILVDACNTGLAVYTGNTLNVFSNFKTKFMKTPR